MQAQLGLALLYDLGQGVPRDGAGAYVWYRRAAMAGVPSAEFNVAVMRDTGDGVARDTADAAVWYGRAAAHGNRRAEYNLGQLYAAGDGVPRNLDAAETWFRDASADLPAAADRLATLRRATRPRPSPGAEASAALLPPQPTVPPEGGIVAPLADGIELVWTAPAQTVPVRFFVQVLALGAAGAPPEAREVFSATLNETAALVPLDHASGRYAWRVYSVSRDLKRYAASGWTRFQVAADER